MWWGKEGETDDKKQLFMLKMLSPSNLNNIVRSEKKGKKVASIVITSFLVFFFFFGVLKLID